MVGLLFHLEQGIHRIGWRKVVRGDGWIFADCDIEVQICLHEGPFYFAATSLLLAVGLLGAETHRRLAQLPLGYVCHLRNGL